jgi:UDP-N-acetylmuramate dehydrogenase
MPATQAPWFIREDVPLAPRTTLEVGGNARFLVEGVGAAALAKVIRHARSRGLATLVLGGGSNVVVSDAGFDGVVALVDEFGIDVTRHGDEHRLFVGAGVVWDELVAFTVDERLAGLECLSGIPGRVGASPIQNIGAYGAEAADTISSVEVLDLDTSEIRRLTPEACGFGYRTSRFKGPSANRMVVTGVEFRLVRGATSRVQYEELRRRLDLGNRAPRPAEVRQAVLELRASKSMLLDPDDENRRSAGSFFMNPVVTPALADQVAQRAAELGWQGTMPRYPAPGDGVKLSAAWLIERSGFEKGFRFGAARTSTRHALAIVHDGAARASDIVSLARVIRRGVQRDFGVTLEPEPVFVGFDQPVPELLS